eukprot:Protomagalhaensia_wolfi_Nauph_80__684@NODE_1390_length_1549_cov_5_735099_g1075_i0_p1_GENE_NODE_1390_length_1549_cov_5_735099_g1075_i0NODE_1390_length_1549_cov_5_735099_g1075_i0_p1_ORF_typecomplete_len450_score99_26Sad1_UNC/PF07738_13/1_3e12CCDC73/PF15818_5/1_8e05MAD/PF05557_13/3_4e05LRRFIP/PF09738_9/3_7e05AIP3/PF03915_13/6_2e05Tht1/PF04163_12/0_0004Phage_HK97_TLTM/PF06120_11/0_0015Laminin_II/PF06009_12/0_001DNA_Packaging/PF11053_8/0_0021zfC4H2/PF10146_9/0_0027FlxA/PF14282_6/0_0056FapA/PF03961_13
MPPNSRKQLLTTAQFPVQDAPPGLYQVRRVAFTQKLPVPEPGGGGGGRADESPLSAASSVCREGPSKLNKPRRSRKPVVALAVLLIGFSWAWLRMPPADSPPPPTVQRDPPLIEPDQLRALLQTDKDASWQLQQEYQRMRGQHEHSMEQLRELQDKLLRIEATHKRESEKNQASEQLSQLKHQISSLTNEITDLKKEYVNLALSNQKESQLETELTAQLERLKHQIESHATRERPNPIPPPPSEAITLLTNLATRQNGARIVKRYTTSGLADEEHWSFWVGKTAAALFPSGRYQSLVGVQSHAAEVVLDEHSIRGPGDCFCARGGSANITLDLGIPLYISSIGIAHAPRQLEMHADRAPLGVNVFAVKHLDDRLNNKGPATDILRLEMSSKNPEDPIASFQFDYPNEQVHREPITQVKAQRVRFSVQAQTGSAIVCVYRVLVYGTVSEQ